MELIDKKNQYMLKFRQLLSVLIYSYEQAHQDSKLRLISHIYQNLL